MSVSNFSENDSLEHDREIFINEQNFADIIDSITIIADSFSLRIVVFSAFSPAVDQPYDGPFANLLLALLEGRASWVKLIGVNVSKSLRWFLNALLTSPALCLEIWFHLGCSKCGRLRKEFRREV